MKKLKNFCFENNSRYIAKSSIFFLAGIIEELMSISVFFPEYYSNMNFSEA